MINLPIHYRYDDYAFEIRVTKFYPSRETKHCYFVVDEWNKYLIDMISKGGGREMLKKVERRVLKNSVRRYCYPTKSEALNSFKMRKISQIKHAEFSLSKAKIALRNLEDVTDNFDSIRLGDSS